MPRRIEIRRSQAVFDRIYLLVAFATVNVSHRGCVIFATNEFSPAELVSLSSPPNIHPPYEKRPSFFHPAHRPVLKVHCSTTDTSARKYWLEKTTPQHIYVLHLYSALSMSI